jgi:uncharacterized protein (TIGR03435 family)
MLAAPVSTISKIVLWNALLCSSSILCQSIPEKSQAPTASQSADTPHLAFDVASIRECPPRTPSSINNVPRSSFFKAECVNLVGLISSTYGLDIPSLLKNVPAWAKTAWYTIEAKSDSSTDEALSKLSDSDSYAQKREMLKALLAERFKLRIHTETEVSTTYELYTTPMTAKLITPVRGDLRGKTRTCGGNPTQLGVDIQATGCPFSLLLYQLRHELGTYVVDNTGLSGNYAYHLMYMSLARPPEANQEGYPHLVDAVHEQLGLELRKTKAPVTFWVIDNFERPSPN